jgi:hypothetical protein
MKVEDFQHYRLKGFLNINTLSPNGKFYYKISGLKEISMNWWTCRIAFFDNNNLLLYHRSNINIAWLYPHDNINFVKWSVDGIFALIFEYQRNLVNEYILLDLRRKESYRINTREKDCKFLDIIEDTKYDGIEIRNKIQESGGQSSPFYGGSMRCIIRWHPSNAKL